MLDSTPTPLRLKEHDRAPGDADIDIDSIRRPHDDEPEPRYRCRQCNTIVASARDELPVDGRLHHERVNPAGLICRFVTVRRCRNVETASRPSTEFTWFEGCSWEIIICSHCVSHLGWRWTSAESAFYGLLLERIST